ncbi:MAG TPA: HAD hydrolase family protein [Candidatus Saccharimonadales bacterium]|nr:HAD hydrolase family protein [Candidatus Saccharimonadales bacterium]
MTTPPDIRTASARPAFVPRALLIDLDGTTIDYRQELLPRVRDAVRAAARSIPVIVATGRMYRSALPWALELGVDQPLVCYQGAMVRGMPGNDGAAGEHIYERELRPEPARRALRLARREGWHFQAYQDDELLCDQDRPEAHLYSSISGVPFRLVDDLEPLLALGTTKAACVIEDPIEVDRASVLMTSELAGVARVTRSNPEFVEILDLAVSKAAACEIVCARFGSTLADAVAIGDAPNDVELLDAAGFAVAVASSRPEVLAAADATCARPEDGGVADVLRALGLG